MSIGLFSFLLFELDFLFYIYLESNLFCSCFQIKSILLFIKSQKKKKKGQIWLFYIAEIQMNAAREKTSHSHILFYNFRVPLYTSLCPGRVTCINCINRLPCLTPFSVGFSHMQEMGGRQMKPLAPSVQHHPVWSLSFHHRSQCLSQDFPTQISLSVWVQA